MLVIHACIVGGMAYAGLKTLMRRRPRGKMTWLVPQGGQHRRVRGLGADEDRHQEVSARFSRASTLSCVSLGCAVLGAYGHPLFSVASVPLAVCGALPMFERASAALFTPGRGDTAVVWSATVIVALATRHYVAAPLLVWCHAVMVLCAQKLRLFTHSLVQELEHSGGLISQVYGATPSSVWVLVDGVGLETPFGDLQVGDTVCMRAGEVVPVDGTVVDGTAEVMRWSASGTGRREGKRPGDHVAASTFVVSGRLSIRVENV